MLILAFFIVIGNMDEIQFEKVKSCYALAQILAVIAGFFLVAGGFTFSNPGDILNTADKSVGLCEKILSFENQTFVPENFTFEDCMKEFQGFFDQIEKGNRQSNFFILVGFLLAFGSVILWAFGRIKLSFEDFPEIGFSIFLAIIDLIMFIVLYYQFIK